MHYFRTHRNQPAIAWLVSLLLVLPLGGLDGPCAPAPVSAEVWQPDSANMETVIGAMDCAHHCAGETTGPTYPAPTVPVPERQILVAPTYAHPADEGGLAAPTVTPVAAPRGPPERVHSTQWLRSVVLRV